MKLNQLQQAQRGLTIIELMIALLLSLLLVGGVVQIYLGTKSTYRVTEGLSRLQENTRFSTDMIARDIRMAGYIPCSQPQAQLNMVNSSKWWAPLFTNSIKGFENGANPFPGDSVNQVLPGSDSILILRGGSKVAAVNFYDAANNEFIMQRDLGTDWVEHGSLMVACDSQKARLFQAGTIQSGNPTKISFANDSAIEKPGNTSTSLNTAFSNDAQLSNYRAVAYYISESTSTDTNSLYRRYLNVNNVREATSSMSEELIEGVDTMQLLYGLDVDDDGMADRYLKADNVAITDWQDVVTVRVSLLFASEDGLRDADGFDENTYVVGNTSIAPQGTPGVPTHEKDKRKRYVTSMTVSIRNL